MILLLIGLGIIGIIVGAIISYLIDEYNEASSTLYIVGSFLAGISFIVFIFILIPWRNSYTAELKVEMLVDHNEEIEHKIDVIVKEYLDYEIDIIKSIDVIFILIPELKGNEIIEQQIDLYIKNSLEIKHYKKSSINQSTYAWWLWFGKGQIK